ncbi:hypothetical protein SynA1544_02737 [Synechococcus sp. A15-44]|nr:hypothetical protein SynA1544_02737 [Synechococcus sp. A15-44]
MSIQQLRLNIFIFKFSPKTSGVGQHSLTIALHALISTCKQTLPDSNCF